MYAMHYTVYTSKYKSADNIWNGRFKHRKFTFKNISNNLLEVEKKYTHNTYMYYTEAFYYRYEIEFNSKYIIVSLFTMRTKT